MKQTELLQPARHFRFSILVVISLLLLLVACSRNSVDAPATTDPSLRALAKVTFSDSGDGQLQSQMTFHPLPGLEGQDLSRVTGGLEVNPTPTGQGSFTANGVGYDDCDNSAGTRFLYAAYEIRNADTSMNAYNVERTNLTFLAVDNNGTDYGTNAVAELSRPDGSVFPPDDTTAIDFANCLKPTHQTQEANGTLEVVSNGASMQVFNEPELDGLGLVGPNTTIGTITANFPYGYVVSNKNGERTLPASPASGQYDGTVTFAIRAPANVDFPSRFSLWFYVFENSETFVVEDFPEQGTTQAETRADALGATTPIRFLGETSAVDNPTTLLCRTRTAGSSGSPSNDLIEQSSPASCPQSGTFPSTVSSSPMVGTNPSSVTNADLNGDGDLDLVVANADTNNVSVLLNNGDGTFATQVTYTIGTNNMTPVFVASADFDDDGDLDLVTTNRDSNNVAILLNDGNGVFNTVNAYGTGDSTNPVATTTDDVNGDGFPDLVTANSSSGNVSILINDTNGAFPSIANTPSVGSMPSSIVSGYFNDGDRFIDVAVANQSGNSASILLGQGDGSFSNASNSPVALGTNATGPVSIVTGDFNRDNDLDLATANSSSDNVSLLLGSGDGQFTLASSSPITVGTSPQSITSSDLDRDSNLDLVTANNGSENVSVLIGNGDGTFAAAVNYGTGAGPASVTSGDLNDDGSLDLATANSGAASVSVLLQQ
ncbi:MAG: VCBS repeat-containing protein [Trueperaceae bacterium]|nr:VCBS repeat-containing protein [Trueperaceae bacterium]